jgi:biotin synthase
LNAQLTRDEILSWLLETDPARLESLWAMADRTRQEHVGDAIWLRGLIEVSNVCVRNCAYCGLAACAPRVERYRMSQEEILSCADQAMEFGFGTVVLQSGEDPGITRDGMADAIREIKSRTGLAVTLSLGERSDVDLRAWRDSGADRYLLRFETSDPRLYGTIHPGGSPDRFGQLMSMRDMGFEIGTGVMVGIPGQTWETLAQDISMFHDYDMDMIGLGPYLESPGTPLAGELGQSLRAMAGDLQVTGDELTVLKAIALTRLQCPDTNIPSTTALATMDPAHGRANGLERGANVVMPNLTPTRYRDLYRIYPGKAGLHETADFARTAIEEQIHAMGRTIGAGPGPSPRTLQRLWLEKISTDKMQPPIF